ncbi:uncharacterized protein MELLADRAFT_103066 [Melampsora larici-populina 98AG31]|uniref:Uncharacterized protein n=1 Tax=Melampsora larici-populina (strain 98AG31 / pathotype 3-4-7) TaxID=747676 RepID=F4RAF5_MELLP|nr:uncharacterized protein MELLADRAFT_103066 [Melampsora larici-populina 98AG31]EGG10791.1 hypothetical protein MELLADRAFT_103066 [Melampsora larici-populina 98AG31]
MSTSNIPLKQSHVLTISGVVETGALLPPSDSRNYSYRACTVAITTKGWNSDNNKEYDGKWTAYCSPLEVPHEGECFVTKARFLPVKDTADFNMYYEADHKIFVGTSETFTGVLHNNTALTGLGIVSSRRTMPADDDTKSVLCFVMKHIDYQPQARKNQYFEIEYRIRPTRNMEQSQKLVQVGRETLISGFIVDFDSEANRFIVEVTSVSPCTGNEGSGATKTDPSGHVTPAGRVRPAKHVPTPVTPTNAVAGPSSAPAATASNKRKAAAAEEPIPSPLAAGRRTRPAKHLPKPPATTSKTPRTQGKGKAKEVLDDPSIESPLPDANMSDPETTIAQPATAVKRAPPKKAPAAKAKKSKASTKVVVIPEEPEQDDEDAAEEDNDWEMEE